MASAIKQQVLRLDVPVNHSGVMGDLHGNGRVTDKSRCFLVPERPISLDAIRQAFAVDQCHRVEVLAGGFANIVYSDDAWMIELRGRLGFGVEAAHLLSVGEFGRTDSLERHDPIEFGLPRFVDDTHAALGDLLQDLVVAEV
ncbi:MAG: hypothetical protein R3B96_01430 [Pirellulaceae bacterium]